MKIEELKMLLGDSEITEEQLEKALDGINSHVNDIRDSALEKQKTEFESATPEPQKEPEQKTETDPMIKALMDRIDAMENANKEKENQNSIAKFTKEAKAKGLSEDQIKFFSESIPGDKLANFDFGVVPVANVPDTSGGNGQEPKEPDAKTEIERQIGLLK